ncbi:MAG: hypothetical protein PUC41_04850 [Oscillospiraceae bacterium]|nr:hypothetical protein [Oscillospiraceae bacterium]
MADGALNRYKKRGRCEIAQKETAIFYQKALETSEKIMYNRFTARKTPDIGVCDFAKAFLHSA